ncbi:acetyl-CoA hydrolase/transferase-like protein [Desulfobotulus alkaliphilus]|uniref:Acetyl-CoA hydrolase/transferase-like protein n=1 Tax=Desulfobotulus alkaliphilus TaxID=622671 RepID=A0A562RTP8_9BACT|nr:acetyl-CoA hydrolase/transferase C-terminal domain-containing protein [Desulfobotulus alkaliphilus]TWI72438.1 acetyl-CoA hydrolase/transferase-like protein [Desulfobotulus alkaliphilus]
MKKPVIFNDPEQMVDFIIENVGKDLVFGTQLGLGKPNNILNAVYRRAQKDQSISLRIITGLSLEPPVPGSELERRFLGPLVERVWGGYVELDYARDMRLKKLPPNVTISEFFYKAGAFMNNPHMQQNYINSNYTHAARDVNLNGMNVAGALLGKKEINGQLKYSVGCNADTAIDAVDIMKAKCEKGFKGIAIGEINNNLPFMFGDAVTEPEVFDAILESPQSDYRLFGAPKESINTIDYCIGLHASTLIPDDGTLQIGIGSLGDAITYGLTVRHKHNDQYRKLLNEAGIMDKYKDMIDTWGGTDPFKKGLYGSTEMLVDTFVDLYKEGIMNRRVYDDIRIQRVVNAGLFTDDRNVTPEGFRQIIVDGGVHRVLTEKDVEFLKRFGVLKESVVYQDGKLVDGGTTVSADMGDVENLKVVAGTMLGDKLKEGYWAHAGFYLGPLKLYDTLNAMSDEERALINMTSVLNVNQLYSNNKYGSLELRVLQRKNARFINAGLMVTLSGMVVSDSLDNLKVVSGIGGQYNFVAMAHALADARGALMIRSTRGEGPKTVSNIVFNYGHCSVPRHLRDIIITEYGIADLRGQSDKNVIKQLLNVADSRFQEGLLEKAKQAGKIESDYRIPDAFRSNYPEKLEKLIAPYKKDGLFGPFPFGTVFTDEEIAIGKALRTFKTKAEISKFAAAKGVIGQFMASVPESAKPYLKRMDLENPANFKEKAMQKVVLCALKDTGAI